MHEENRTTWMASAKRLLGPFAFSGFAQLLDPDGVHTQPWLQDLETREGDATMPKGSLGWGTINGQSQQASE